MVTVTFVPNNVVTTCPLDNIPDLTLSASTWCFKIFVKSGRSFNRAVIVPGGRALNAASVGANKVNGPGPCRYADKPQVSIAVFKML
jgi:hypothetical protein